MKKEKISDSLKSQTLQKIQEYNKANKTEYLIHFRNSYAYLSRRSRNGEITKIGRLKYQPKTKEWDFVVFKYSSEKYDPNEWLFPGQELLDGTIEGAMKAGHEIYSDEDNLDLGFSLKGCFLILILLPIALISFSARLIFKTLKKAINYN